MKRTWQASVALFLLFGCWSASGQETFPPAVLELTGSWGCGYVINSIQPTFGILTNGIFRYGIFGNQLLSSADVGRRIVVTERDDPDFAPLAAMLTSGHPGPLCFEMNGGPCVYREEGPPAFAPMPAGGNGIDFAGFHIVSFALQFDTLSFITYNGWTEVFSRFRIFVNYEALPPPSIVQEPVSQTAESGSDVVFLVRANSSAPLNYQWFFNGSNAIAGGTRSALQLPDVHADDAGAYCVVVTNTFGAVTSAPVMLSVIPPVERNLCPGLLLTADPGTDLYLGYATAPSPSPNWVPLATVRMGGILGPSSQWYFDGLTFSARQRFYRVWHENDGSVVPGLEFHAVPAITLRGSIGNSFWIDYINQVGPTDAWAQLATVTLTNNSQPYFDTTSVGEPPRLYRVSTTFRNLDFELATAIPDTPGYSVGFTQAFPGWTGSEGVVQYDYTWLDSAGISILDTNSTSPSVAGVLHGRYCACLYAGWELWVEPRHDIPVWIAQTGKIPVTAATLLFNYKPLWPNGELLVTFKGIGISLRTVSSGVDGSSVLGGDVSQFAGQVGELRITAPVRYPNNPHQLNASIVDYIRFSTTPLSP